MLYKIPYGTPLMLILYNDGGDIDTAENIFKKNKLVYYFK